MATARSIMRALSVIFGNAWTMALLVFAGGMFVILLIAPQACGPTSACPTIWMGGGRVLARLSSTRARFSPACFLPVNGYADSFDQQSRSGTTGKTKWIGKAKFYEGTLPADFVRAPDPKMSPAGALRFTGNQPSFVWDGTGTEHDLTRTWDCSAIGSNAVGSVQPVPADVNCQASTN